MVKDIIAKQRSFFATNTTKDVEFRIQQLQKLKTIIKENETKILEALKQDLRKPLFEAYTSEILGTIEEINYALKHIKTWTKPKKVSTPPSQFPSTSYVYSDPLGVVLIIGPWNYPFALLINPLVAAIAAGNCAVLKPSEISSHTSKVIAQLINDNFSPEFVTVVEGGVETSQALLAEKFDHIFFTGGTAIGRIVMEAAAKHLTPVTLELGGKSPCIVDKEVDLELAARRLSWGKFFNAGQTCIAPDYILVNKSIKADLIGAIQKCIHEFYGDNPRQSSDYGRIISERQFQRLVSLLSSGKTVCGGDYDLAERYIAPTVLDQVTWDDAVMADEIFGPILPILEYENLSDAIALINSKPKPLALYIFSTSKQNQEKVLKEAAFGGGCINDTIMHLSTPELPFGGIGDSGIGAYHGKAGFDTFSHRKSVLNKSFLFDFKWRYPPYKMSLDILKRLV